ncbi:exosortase A [Novosphingobium profundi]|uniref:exosortase A n=1 Tax=Novosphingobium profundi TaxID=1774954 RepID=UPI001BDAFB26|nr:exosortase A [Novosphingobium profundi]MBT0669120.1 exosortase A [Novosphingobium profundi]
MSHDISRPHAPTAADGPGLVALSRPWRSALIALGLAWLVQFGAFAADWGAMVRQWWDISTYNHMLLIPLVEVWLVWQRRRELARLTPRAWAPGLVLFALAACLWLLGGVSGFDLLRQAGVVAMLAASVPLLLGAQVTAAVLFPLFYLVFIVPFGEELVKPLQMITAEITIALTHLSGIAAVIDGVFIDTPVGLFEVAEACSGVKFLIAMVAFGVLAANVCFVSWPRRLVLLLACLVVPILANGVRAWGTIYAAQIFGVEVAAGFDHIVYGWFFFAIILTLVILGAWRFFDRPADAPMIDLAAITGNRTLAWLGGTGAMPLALALASCLVLVAGVRVWAQAADRLAAPLPARIALPDVTGWHRVPYDPRVWWEPRAQGAEHRLLGRYADGEGRVVDVFVALYSGQGEGREAGGFGEGALMRESTWSWQAPAVGPSGGRGERLLANGTLERVAVTWYRNGTLLSGSNLGLKLAVIDDQLFLRAEPTVMLIVSAEERGDRPAAQSIARFVGSTGDLARWMDALAGLR